MGISTQSVFNAANRFTAIAGALSALAPIVSILIDVVQKAVPAAENAGAQKFQHVLDGAKTWLINVGNQAAQVEQLVPALGLMINQAVDAYKGRVVLVQQPNGQQAWVQTPPAATTDAPAA